MKRQLLILILILTISRILYAQTSNDWLNKANEKLKNKDYKGAIADYDRAISLGPKFTEAYEKRGEAKFFFLLYADAINDFHQAIALDTKDKNVYDYCSEAEIQLERYSEAFVDCNMAIKLDPNDKNACDNCGCAESQLGEYANAVAYFEQAISIDPKDKYAYYNCGKANIEIGHYADAIKDYDKLIELTPGNSSNIYTYNHRGYAYFKLGVTKENYLKAIADWDRSEKSAGEYYQPDFRYRDDAVDALDKADGPLFTSTDTSAENAKGWIKDTYFKIYARDYNRAIADGNWVVLLYPKFADAYYMRGYVYYLLADTKSAYLKAIADYDKSIQLGGTSYEYFDKYRDKVVADMAKAKDP